MANCQWFTKVSLTKHSHYIVILTLHFSSNVAHLLLFLINSPLLWWIWYLKQTNVPQRCVSLFVCLFVYLIRNQNQYIYSHRIMKLVKYWRLQRKCSLSNVFPVPVLLAGWPHHYLLKYIYWYHINVPVIVAALLG